jgi:hypothetical protein
MDEIKLNSEFINKGIIFCRKDIFDMHCLNWSHIRTRILIRSVADPDPGSGAFLTLGSGILDG